MTIEWLIAHCYKRARTMFYSAGPNCLCPMFTYTDLYIELIELLYYQNTSNNYALHRKHKLGVAATVFEVSLAVIRIIDVLEFFLEF